MTYQPVLGDRLLTMERNTFYLAFAAHSVLAIWMDTNSMVQGTSEEFDLAMRELMRAISETDIFMSGYAQGLVDAGFRSRPEAKEE